MYYNIHIRSIGIKVTFRFLWIFSMHKTKNIELKCKICNKEYNSVRSLGLHIAFSHNITIKTYYDSFLKTDNEGICPVCGNETTFNRSLNRGYLKFCSTKCAQTSKETRNKQKDTNLQKYGNICPIQNDKIKAKVIEKFKLKYNTDCPLKNSDIRAKINDTVYKKYGTTSTACISYVRNKMVKTYKLGILEKYNNELKQNIDILDINEYNVQFKCNTCNKISDLNYKTFRARYIQNAPICPICNPLKTGISIGETSLLTYIKTIFNGTILTNIYNIIYPFELDIYLPDKNIAFEYDGLYWHNELNKDSLYHLNKTKLCENNNIRLIHIFEDEWIHKQNIVKSYIKEFLGLNETIPAESCIIKNITQEISDEFLNVNHILGYYNATNRYGLYYNNELVSVMLINISENNKGSCEIIRYCNKLNTHISNGLSKLFYNFINEHTEIYKISFLMDRRWPNEKLYENLGFIKNNSILPDYYYVIDDTRHNKYEFFNKEKITDCEYNTMIHKNMLDKKIYKIYDCGNIEFIWKR